MGAGVEPSRRPVAIDLGGHGALGAHHLPFWTEGDVRDRVRVVGEQVRHGDLEAFGPGDKLAAGVARDRPDLVIRAGRRRAAVLRPHGVVHTPVKALHRPDTLTQRHDAIVVAGLRRAIRYAGGRVVPGAQAGAARVNAVDASVLEVRDIEHLLGGVKAQVAQPRVGLIEPMDRGNVRVGHIRERRENGRDAGHSIDLEHLTRLPTDRADMVLDVDGGVTGEYIAEVIEGDAEHLPHA